MVVTNPSVALRMFIGRYSRPRDWCLHVNSSDNQTCDAFWHQLPQRKVTHERNNVWVFFLRMRKKQVAFDYYMSG